LLGSRTNANTRSAGAAISNHAAAGVGARDTQGGRRGFGARLEERAHLRPREQGQQRLHELDVKGMVERQQRAPSRLLLGGGVHLLARIAEQLGSERHQIVDVFVAIDVVNAGALAALEVHRRRLWIDQRTAGQVVPAGNDAPSSLEERCRARIALSELVFTRFERAR
jgi:hypothetical protein